MASIVKPCFAALGLANDYYSFDIEWKEFQETSNTDETPTMTNAVALYMKWDDLSIDDAKEKVRQVVRDYERGFQYQMDTFIADRENCSQKLAEYLRALAFQIPGNIVWSLRCPRYHPELCAEGETLLQRGADNKTNTQNEQEKGHLLANLGSFAQEYSDSESSRPSSSGTTKSNPSSRSSMPSLDTVTDGLEGQKPVHLDTEVSALIILGIPSLLCADVASSSSFYLLPSNISALCPQRVFVKPSSTH